MIWQHERITTILVTHDVDEVRFLADRVVTMAPRPGRIRCVLEVGLPRPRERHDPRLHALRQTLLDDFDVDLPQPGVGPAAANQGIRS